MADITVPIAIRDLVVSDLDGMGWSGSPSHLSSVRAELGRVASGAVEYLAACTASDLPVGKLGIDYALAADAGTIYQAAVHPALQSCGIGTLLVGAAERRILARGRSWSELAVEHDNPRARALYERLGYRAYGDKREEWDAEGADGVTVRHATMCTVMRKTLSTSSTR
jgi:ribosomal protein S18 acetylase RimI-like enzyme